MQNGGVGHFSVSPCAQIVNMSSGLASKDNLAANLRGEGLYQMATKMGLAYRSSKAALCMGKFLDNPCRSIEQPTISAYMG